MKKRKIYSNKKYRFNVNEISDVWTIYSQHPGIALSEISELTGMQVKKICAIRDFLFASKLITFPKEKLRAIRAIIPLVNPQRFENKKYPVNIRPIDYSDFEDVLTVSKVASHFDPKTREISRIVWDKESGEFVPVRKKTYIPPEIRVYGPSPVNQSIRNFFFAKKLEINHDRE